MKAAENKNVFVIFYADEDTQRCLHRVCNAMDITICYDSAVLNGANTVTKEQMLWESIQKSEEITTEHKRSINSLQRYIVSNERRILEWKNLLLKKKAIKTVLNMCDIQGSADQITSIRMNGWCCSDNASTIQSIFDDITADNTGSIQIQHVTQYHPKSTAPTAFDRESECVLL